MLWTCALVLVLACSDAGDAPTATNDGSGLKILRDARRSEHKTLDPMKQFDQASAEIIMNVYDTLLEYHYLHRPYRLAPNLLALLPEKQADGVTYVFRLRPGIHFHDDPCFEGGTGRELTSDDAIYSIKRFADANVNIKSYALGQQLMTLLSDQVNELFQRLGLEPADVFMDRLLGKPWSC